MLVEGQIAGGFAQGLGGALLEEFLYDERGEPLSVNFADYLMPTAREVPPLDVVITEDAPSPLNPLGLKGAGEGGANAVGAAVASAIDDAIGMPGAITRLPVTPQRLREILRQAADAVGACVARHTDRIAALRRDVAGEVGHAALPSQLALLEHIDAIGNQLGKVDVLLGQQHRQPFLLQLDDRRWPSASTITGATPSDGSSSATSSGLPISVRATVSICCSPPLICAPRRSVMRPRLGKIANSFSGVHDGAGRPSGKRRGGWRPMSRFSSTVRSEKMRRSSGTKPSPRRAISNARSLRNVLAAEPHVPLRRAISAISALMVVDLPAPLRPISATTSPRPTSNDRSNRICAAPYQAFSPLHLEHGRAHGAASGAP